VLAAESGQNDNPGVVAELGPGGSLGVGIAALLTGAARYLAFDVVAHANVERNIIVLDELVELVELFRARSAIPDGNEFPDVSPRLEDYRFPEETLGRARMDEALMPDRIAVACPRGIMSHEIDFKSHGWASAWNGHWSYSDTLWKLIRGRDSWFINRVPASAHLELLQQEGYRVIRFDRESRPNQFKRHQLSKRFQQIPNIDLETSEAFLQATKMAYAALP
jgi:hypothetical protein